MTRTILLLLLSCWGLYSPARGQSSNLFPVVKNGKAGYIDQAGKIAIPLKFDEARSFSDGLAAVRIGDDWGYISASGKVVIKPQFFSASSFCEGLANVGIYWDHRRIVNSTVGYDGYINKTGQVVTKDHFGVAFDFSDGLAAIQTEDYRNGFIDSSGKIVLFADTYPGSNFKHGRALFKTNGNMPDSKVGFIDKSGKPAIPASYLYGLDFSEGLACVSSETGSGFIDPDGKVVIDLKYNDCSSFSEELAAVLIDGLIGFIDKSGKIVIEPKFARVIGDESRFSDGVAVVQIGESEQPTKEGKRDVRIDAERNMYAAKSGLFGVIDKSGKFIIAPKYVQIGDFHNGLAWVNLGDAYIIHGDTDRWGYMNKKGEIVWRSF